MLSVQLDKSVLLLGPLYGGVTAVFSSCYGPTAALSAASASVKMQASNEMLTGSNWRSWQRMAKLDMPSGLYFRQLLLVNAL